VSFDIQQYHQALADNCISIIYSGPIWAGGIGGMADMLQRRLQFDEVPFSSSQAVFSIFVEQISNMMMHSAEKEQVGPESAVVEASKGVFILGMRDKQFYVQTGNVVTAQNAKLLKSRIDHLNTLDKQALRQYFREQTKVETEITATQGAGLGLIEIARKATSKIQYEFNPYGDGQFYFTMFVTI
jgi:hypothetical protein